jgi:hypothetical protein
MQADIPDLKEKLAGVKALPESPHTDQLRDDLLRLLDERRQRRLQRARWDACSC